MYKGKGRGKEGHSVLRVVGVRSHRMDQAVFFADTSLSRFGLFYEPRQLADSQSRGPSVGQPFS